MNSTYPISVLNSSSIPGAQSTLFINIDNLIIASGIDTIDMYRGPMPGGPQRTIDTRTMHSVYKKREDYQYAALNQNK